MSSSNQPNPGTAAASVPPGSTIPVTEPPKWHTSLCGCCSDWNTCCLGFWCPCVLAGRNYEAIGQESCRTAGTIFCLLCFFTGCQAIYQCFNRKEIAKTYGLEHSSCNAFCAHWCCGGCALCQDAREIQYRQKLVQLGQQPQFVTTNQPPAQQNMGKQ